MEIAPPPNCKIAFSFQQRWLINSLIGNCQCTYFSIVSATGHKKWDSHKKWDWKYSFLRSFCTRWIHFYMYTTLTASNNNGVCRHHSVIPSLPTMPSPGGNNNQWSWMIVVCLGASWVAPRRTWDNGGRHGWEVRLVAHFVSVLCIVLCGRNCCCGRK